MIRCPAGMPFPLRTRGVSPDMDAAMPKKQTTAAKKARAAARAGEKYTTALRRQSPGDAAAVPPAPETGVALGKRSPWSHAMDFRPFRGTTLFDRIGGQPVVDRL